MTRKSVLSSSIWSSASTLVSVPFLAGTTIALARILDPAGFGRYALYTFLTAILSAIADFGIGISILRRGAVAAGNADEEATLAAVRAGTTWSMVQIPVESCRRLSHTADVVDRRDLRCLYCPHAGIPRSFPLRDHDEPASTTKLAYPCLGSHQHCRRVSHGVSTHQADLVFAVSALVSGLPTIPQVFAVPKRLRRTVFLPGKLNVSRADIGFGLGNLINSQLNTFVFSKSELLFFQAKQADARGQFAAIQTIAVRATLVPDALLGPLSFGLAGALGKGQETLRRSFRLSCDAVVMLFTLICPVTLAGIAVLTEPVLGPGYHGITGLALVLTVMSLLQTGATPLLCLRFAERRVRPLIIAGLVATMVDAGGAALLVPHYGVAGAVIASSAGSASYLICTLLLFRSETAIMDIALSHTLRVAASIVYSSLPAVALLTMPLHWEYVVALPLVCAWTLGGLRIYARERRGAIATEAVIEALPDTLGKSLRTRPARWLLQQK